MRDRRYLEDLTTEELERELVIRRREERLARLRRVVPAGRTSHTILVPEPDAPVRLPDAPLAAYAVVEGAAQDTADAGAKTPFQIWRERVLLGIEIAALVGLVVVVISFVTSVRRLNRDWKEQQSVDSLPEATATPLIRVSILPGGHKPPTTRGGTPEPVGLMPKVAIPTPGPRSPTRLVIPGISIDVPVVEGVDWEQLKKGAGHHLGSARKTDRPSSVHSRSTPVGAEQPALRGQLPRLPSVCPAGQRAVASERHPYRTGRTWDAPWSLARRVSKTRVRRTTGEGPRAPRGSPRWSCAQRRTLAQPKRR